MNKKMNEVMYYIRTINFDQLRKIACFCESKCENKCFLL